MEQPNERIVERMFEIEGAAAQLYNMVQNLHFHDLKCDREENGTDRVGLVLAYLAQLIKNVGDERLLESEVLPEAVNAVVVTGFAYNSHLSSPKLVVAINIHPTHIRKGYMNIFEDAAMELTEYIPWDVEIAFPAAEFSPYCSVKSFKKYKSTNLNRIARGKKLERFYLNEKVESLLDNNKQGCYNKNENGRDIQIGEWHGEQKLIRYIKVNYGEEGRKALRAIGIAHIYGPCTKKTAGAGTQRCKKYLKNKEDNLKPVVAYWFSDVHNQDSINVNQLKALKNGSQLEAGRDQFSASTFGQPTAPIYWSEWYNRPYSNSPNLRAILEDSSGDYAGQSEAGRDQLRDSTLCKSCNSPMMLVTKNVICSSDECNWPYSISSTLEARPPDIEGPYLCSICKKPTYWQKLPNGNIRCTKCGCIPYLYGYSP